jgi:hypothetical protein
MQIVLTLQKLNEADIAEYLAAKSPVVRLSLLFYLQLILNG